MERNRNAATQAQMLRDSVIRKWGKQAWARFGEREQEALLGLEFMALVGAQENDGNETMNHYRETARVLLSGE